MSARPYRLGKRQAVVEATRQRVIGAARDLFSEPGFHHATLDDVARRAGVARATVYYQFESRSGLLDAVLGDAMRQPAAERLRRAPEHPDAAAAVQLYVRAACRFWGGAHALFRNLSGLAAADPEIATMMDRHEKRRREMLVWLVKRLDDQALLRQDVSPGHAVDVLWMLTAFRSFDHLRSRSELAVRPAAAILSTLAATLLRERAMLAARERQG